MRNTHIYQIYYNEASRQALDPNFIPLDNSANLRPDWSEYWVIRNFLLSNELQENDLYGFFSPKFNAKTELSGEQVHQFIQAQADGLDLIAISPFWDMAAFFRNIFDHGDHEHNGLMDIMQKFTHAIGQTDDIKGLIMHSQNTIFSNYFVATPRFWQRWLTIGEALFNMAESDHVLAEELNRTTRHAGVYTYPFKVFIQERLASLLLASEKWHTAFYNTFDLRANMETFAECRKELILCDALKQAYVQTGHEIYMTEYYALRNKVTDHHNQRCIEDAAKRADA